MLSDRSKLSKIVFIIGTLFFTFFHLYVFLGSSSQRQGLFNYDDSLMLLNKAPQMQHCFLQDCTALNDLREQLTTPSDDYKVAIYRYETHKNFFQVYHPLHSLILIGIHNIGVSWETASKIMFVMGGLIVNTALAFLLRRIFGELAAGVTLLWSAPYIFPWYGFYNIVPNVWAMALGLIALLMVLSSNKYKDYAILALMLGMILFHPIGRVYSLILLGVYALMIYLEKGWRLDRRAWIMMGLGGMLVLIPFILPLMIHNPVISVDQGPFPPGWEGFGFLKANLTEMGIYLSYWAESFSYLPEGLTSIVNAGILLALIIFGIAGFQGEQRKRLMVILLVYGAALICSLLVMVPRFPAYLFATLWPPMAMFLNSLLSVAFIRVAKKVNQFLRQGFEFSDFFNMDFLLKNGFRQILLFVGLFFFLAIFNKFIGNGVRLLNYNVHSFTQDTYYYLSPEQADLLHDEIQPGMDVLYMSREIAFHYMIHDLWDSGAVLYDALNTEEEFDHWLINNPDIGYVVNWNPVFGFQRMYEYWESGISMEKEGKLIVSAENPIILQVESNETDFYLKIENSGKSSQTIIIRSISGEKVAELILPARYSGWQKIDIADQKKVQITLQENADGVFIQGIRLGEPGDLNWPWDQGVTLSAAVGDGTEMVIKEFNSKDLFPGNAHSVVVLDDSGSSVLARVER